MILDQADLKNNLIIKTVKNKFFMEKSYIHIYNKLIELARNKELYKDFEKQDIFSDRLTFFLLHFAIFFKVFKNKDNKK